MFEGIINFLSQNESEQLTLRLGRYSSKHAIVESFKSFLINNLNDVYVYDITNNTEHFFKITTENLNDAFFIENLLFLDMDRYNNLNIHIVITPHFIDISEYIKVSKKNKLQKIFKQPDSTEINIPLLVSKDALIMQKDGDGIGLDVYSKADNKYLKLLRTHFDIEEYKKKTFS